MTTRASTLLRATCAIVVPMSLLAQQPPPSAPVEKRGAESREAASAYSYRPEGRRDPFVSLVGRGAEPGAEASRPPGLRGLMIGEVAVKGIMKDRTGFVALLQGSDDRTYTVRAGQRLRDGSVKSVTSEAVIFSQSVSDAFAAVGQREIVKKLRSDDGGRE